MCREAVGFFWTILSPEASLFVDGCFFFDSVKVVGSRLHKTGHVITRSSANAEIACIVPHKPHTAPKLVDSLGYITHSISLALVTFLKTAVLREIMHNGRHWATQVTQGDWFWYRPKASMVCLSRCNDAMKGDQPVHSYQLVPSHALITNYSCWHVNLWHGRTQPWKQYTCSAMMTVHGTTQWISQLVHRPWYDIDDLTLGSCCVTG